MGTVELNSIVTARSFFLMMRSLWVSFLAPTGTASVMVSVSAEASMLSAGTAMLQTQHWQCLKELRHLLQSSPSCWDFTILARTSFPGLRSTSHCFYGDPHSQRSGMLTCTKDSSCYHQPPTNLQGSH